MVTNFYAVYRFHGAHTFQPQTVSNNIYQFHSYCYRRLSDRLIILIPFITPMAHRTPREMLPATLNRQRLLCYYRQREF